MTGINYEAGFKKKVEFNKAKQYRRKKIYFEISNHVLYPNFIFEFFFTIIFLKNQQSQLNYKTIQFKKETIILF